MKTLFRTFVTAKFLGAAPLFLCLIAGATLMNAAQLKEARVTQVVKDVKLLPTQAAPRPAVVSDHIRNGTAVRTGVESRAELTFPDLTLTRLGANTIFSFNEGTREMNLNEGAILFQVPKGAGGATIRTAAVTAAITGTTGIIETHRPTASNPRPIIKVLVLEGVVRLTLTNGSGQTVQLRPGQMEVTDGNSLPQPLTFDISVLVNTSLFFTAYEIPLASLPLILLELQKQLDLKIAGGFVYAGQASFGQTTDFIDAIDQAMTAEEANQTGPPSKFGAPVVITSPDPYVISTGTTIQTDPTITTNGVTDFGKIWRGPAEDGPLSAFIFGSTSAFDIASGFDTEISGEMGGAGFKFTSLELTGDPTISTTNGSVNLGLIAVNGITSGGPGGVLTFAGIRGLLLATQNGSINLGSEISFSGLHDINFYARGSGSNLTLASAISANNRIRLFAEGTIQVNGAESTINFRAFSGGDFDLVTGSVSAEDIFIHAGGNVNLNGGTFSATATNSEGNFDISAGNQIQITNSLSVSQTNSGQLTGLNISLQGGNAIKVGGDLSLTTDASNLESGGNIIVTSDGDITVGGAFSLFTDVDASSTTGTGGNITVNSGGSLRAASLDFNLFFDPSNQVTKGENLVLSVARNLTTSSADGVNLRLSTPIGKPLINGGNLTMTIGGNLTAAAAGDVALLIVNTVDTTVPNGANLLASIGGDLNAGAISAKIDNFDNGGIGTGGNLTFNVTGGLDGSSLLIQIDNTFGGDITNGGNVVFQVGGDLTTTGAATFNLLNNDGGHIGTGGNLSVAVEGDLTAASVDALINNSNGGTIDSGGHMAFNVGSATVTGDATFQILGSDGAAAAAININGGTYDVGTLTQPRTFLAFIDGDGTITFNNASAHADVLKVGALGTNGVLNIGGGTLSADSTLKLYASGSNGQLNFISDVTLGGNGAKILAADSVTIFNGVTVTIGGSNPADVYTNNANYTGSGGNGSTTGTFAGTPVNDPQPLSNAPPFDDPPIPAPRGVGGPTRVNVNPRTFSRTNVTSSDRSGFKTINEKPNGVIRVSDSGELLSLLDRTVPGTGGKITIPASSSTSNRRNSGRRDVAGGLNADHRTANIRSASSVPASRLP